MKMSALRTAYAVVVLCGLVYAFIVLRGPNGIPGLLEKRRQVQEYEQMNQKLIRQIAEKQQRIQRLEGNPAEQEYEIRQRLKLARPGEKIYILDDSKK
ncbi:MAG TPA: septum formation initiator family protein [Bryobacteraceae bacterium]|nr:septum formation initiator family protein [Bryobacteraceae bacterium]